MRTHFLRLSLAAAMILGGLAVVAPTTARAAETAAGPKIVEATGEAAINDGDTVQAKERATKAALRAAVEQTLGTYIASDSQTKDFQLAKDQILSTAQGFVQSYDVLEAKPDPQSPNTMVVKIKATVSAQKIEKDAQARGLAIRAMKFPRMAVLIAEQNIGQSAPSFAYGPQGGGQQAGQLVSVDQRVAETRLIGEWTKDGFSFVDMEALSGKLKLSRGLSTNPSADDVRSIANMSDADVIIVGTAIATKQGDLGKMLNDKSGDVQMTSCKGNIQARVFNADSGEILTTSSADKTKLHIDALVCGRMALNDAAGMLAADLQKKILETWNKRMMGASRVRMSIEGIPNFRALSDIKTLLKDTIRGVQSVEQKSFGNSKADLDLRIDGGDTEALAGDLDGKPLGKYKLRVTNMTANTIAVAVEK